MVRVCVCSDKGRKYPFDFSRTNPFCTYHALERYAHHHPERFQKGAFLLPAGLRGRKSCSIKALIKVVRDVVRSNPSLFSDIIKDTDFITSHIFRRSTANHIVSTGGSNAGLIAGGEWKAVPSVFSYVPKESVNAKAVYDCLVDADSSDSDDDADPGPGQLPPAKSSRRFQVSAGALAAADAAELDDADDVFRDIADPSETRSRPKRADPFDPTERATKSAAPKAVPKAVPKAAGRPTSLSVAARTAGSNPSRFFSKIVAVPDQDHAK